MTPPDTIFVSKVFSDTYRIIRRSHEEGWNWRREKRELRKGSKSTYTKAAVVPNMVEEQKKYAR